MDDADGPARDEVQQLDVASTLERYHELAKETQNPMYGWLALELLFTQVSPLGEPIREDVVIPGWVAGGLQHVTQNLIMLSAGIDPREPGVDGPVLELVDIDPEKLTESRTPRPPFVKLMKLVPLALGLTREAGWNAFSELNKTTQKMQEFRIYEALTGKGLSAKKAMKKIHSLFGPLEDRTRQQRIQDGKNLAGSKVRKPRRGCSS